jgi:flagellar basal body-associated protein FliL
MLDAKTIIELVSSSVNVVSVVVGVVISVLSFNGARVKEAEARMSEAEARALEAAKPFYTLRQELYVDVLKQAAVLANETDDKIEDETEDQTDEVKKARKRFRELYVAELSMVEAPAVESMMRELAAEIDPEILKMNDAQKAAYRLAHALRDTFTYSWQVK